MWVPSDSGILDFQDCVLDDNGVSAVEELVDIFVSVFLFNESQRK